MKRRTSCFIFALLFVFVLIQPAGAEEFRFRIKRNYNIVEFGTYQPYFDKNGRTMVPLCHSHEILQGKVTWEIKNDNVTFFQPGWEYSNTVTIQIGSNILIKNGESVEMDTVPVIRNDEIYFPLRAVAEALDHYVDWEEEFQEINVIYKAAQLYLWNENKDSSLEGMRYAIYQNPETKGYEEVKEQGLSDFEALYDLLESFSDPITIALFYQVEGYKISKEIWSEIDKLEPPRSGWYEVQVTSLEPIIQGIGDFTNRWYTEQIAALDGTDLKQYEGECYRFTCIPSFWEPFMIFVEINADGSGTLSFSMCEAPIGAFEGELLKKKEKSLTKEQVDEFLEVMKQQDFWNLPIEIDYMGFDGENWVIEGVKDGNYHILDRWSPREGQSAHAIGNAFSKLFGENIYERDDEGNIIIE